MAKKTITVLGINDGHDCGAALIRDGKILAAVQEERLSNVKHHSGTPALSIKEAYKVSRIDPSETDAIALVSLNRLYAPSTEYPLKVKFFEKISPLLHGKTFAKVYVSFLSKFRENKELNKLIQEMGLDDKELIFIEHHRAHASCAYRSSPWGYDKPVLIMTSDGAGDGLSSTVSIGEKGEISRIASSTFYNSLGNAFYSEITRYLGMKPWDHEYKCVTGDTPILLADGSIKRIDKIFEETVLISREFPTQADENEEIILPCSIDVLSPDSELKIVRAKATQVYRKRIRNGTLIKVRTKSGREVTTTPNHKFLTLDEEGNELFVESSKLKKGQFIGIPNKIRLDLSTRDKIANLEDSRAKIIGYVVTDGTITHRPERNELTYSFFNKEITLHNSFAQACKQVVGREPKQHSYGNNLLTSRISFWKLRDEWLYQELMPGSSSKDIPNCILCMRDEDIASFMRDAFDCDGGVIVNKNGSSCVVLTTMSRNLSNKIAYLLLRLGIFATLSRHQFTTYDYIDKTKKRTFTFFWVKITGKTNLKKFQDRVGFDNPIKQERLAKIIEGVPAGSTKIDLLPVHKLVRSIVVAQKPHWKMYIKYVHGYRNANHGRNNIRKLVEELDHLGVETEQTRRLKTLVESHVLWDRVDSVSAEEVHDTWVYDLYVPIHHTFVGGYGAMILHNTMGLAPYGKAEYCYDKMKKIIRINPNNPLEFQNIFRSYLKSMQPKLQRLLAGERFDNIAAACQAYYEDLFTTWVRNAVKKTDIHRIAFAGGNILNVKANKKVLEMDCVEDAFFYPPAGDEGTPAGAALEAYFEICSRDGIKAEHHPLEDLYNGPEYTDEEILSVIKSEGLEDNAQMYDGGIDETVGSLISEGKIVARFSGRVENGPRSLGNRSILADPRNFKIVREINTAIKQRDFWMPFAPTILEERSSDYLLNPRPARYMILGFDTPEKTRYDLSAAMHPQDFTVRPQTLNSWNPGYRKVIEKFESSSGVGGVLNTSFNLHGYPIAGTPSMAIWTFKNSGLQYLAIGGYLIRKQH